MAQVSCYIRNDDSSPSQRRPKGVAGVGWCDLVHRFPFSVCKMWIDDLATRNRGAVVQEIPSIRFESSSIDENHGDVQSYLSCQTKKKVRTSALWFDDRPRTQLQRRTTQSPPQLPISLARTQSARPTTARPIVRSYTTHRTPQRCAQ